MKAKTNNQILIQIALLLLGTVMIVLGLLRGEALDIFRFTTRVCMECIGIG